MTSPVGVSAFERLEALVANDALYELADAVPDEIVTDGAKVAAARAAHGRMRRARGWRSRWRCDWAATCGRPA